MCAKAKPQNLSSIGEFGLINKIRRYVKNNSLVIMGIGDDTAVLKVPPGKVLLQTTDMLVEGVHFTKTIPAKLIGRKSIACSISDIAAMGGIPKFALISLGVSGNEEVPDIMKLFEGMFTVAKEYGVAIVGGDIVESKKLIINVAMSGYSKEEDVVYRSGANAGDVIFVTGSFGNSLKNKKHLKFSPRVKESQYLVKKFNPTSMIDISDGLASDLGHILEESLVGAILIEDNIPLSKGATIKKALHDGEDFELLFTLNPADAWKIEKCKLPFDVFSIGRIISESKNIRMLDKGGKEKIIDIKGYTHF